MQKHHSSTTAGVATSPNPNGSDQRRWKEQNDDPRFMWQYQRLAADTLMINAPAQSVWPDDLPAKVITNRLPAADSPPTCRRNLVALLARRPITPQSSVGVGMTGMATALRPSPRTMTATASRTRWVYPSTRNTSVRSSSCSPTAMADHQLSPPSEAASLRQVVRVSGSSAPNTPNRSTRRSSIPAAARPPIEPIGRARRFSPVNDHPDRNRNEEAECTQLPLRDATPAPCADSP
jgi:hypothetical protein